jgi:hypothetical protein
MIGKWGSWLFLAGLLVIIIGCRTPLPELKPPKSPEELREPPPERRYEKPEYPARAFEGELKTRAILDKSAGGPAMRGMPGAGGIGGMGGR